MKIKTLAAFAALTLLFVSCRKDIPSDKLGFIGTWTCTSCSEDETKTILIKSDGTGKYDDVKPGSEKSFGGYVRFDGSNYSIGGKFIKKKFKTDKYPIKKIITLTPYKYEWTAEFNGEAYLKTKEE